MKSALAVLFAAIFWLEMAGQAGFFIAKGERQVDIPFEYENDFIVLTLVLDRSFPLRFIFDTGAEHILLTKREVPDLLGIRYEREFRMMGSDLKTELIAYLAKSVRLEAPGKVAAPSQAVLVLDEDYFRFEEFAGINVHGIIGASAFSRYVIKINYRTQTLTLIERDRFAPPKGFERVDIEVNRNKPYFFSPIRLQNGSVFKAKLLIDTGAALGLMLFSNVHPSLCLPDRTIPGNIGMGLGGFLEGFLGRTRSVGIGAFELPNPLTQFQALDTLFAKKEFVNERHGLVGNQILSRFVVILDLGDEKLYLKPQRKFDRPFEHDRSGLSLVTAGLRFERVIVQDVLHGSPAAEAGFLKGDRILKIGRTTISTMRLENAQKRLIGSAGKTLKVKIRRGDEIFWKQIELRDLI